MHRNNSEVVSVTPQTLENTLHETEHCLDILRAGSGELDGFSLQVEKNQFYVSRASATW